MVASGYRLILLIPATGGPALPGGTFRLGIPHKAYMETPLPEVHLPGYLHLDLPGPAETKILIRSTWANTRGLLEFQLLQRNPRHSAAIMAVKQCPTAPEGVAYQLADYAASRCQ